MKTKRNNSNRIHIEEVNTETSWKQKGMACAQAEGKQFSELMRSLAGLRPAEGRGGTMGSSKSLCDVECYR